MQAPSSYSLDAILPHRPPMRFVESVTRTGRTTIQASFTVPDSGPWVSSGVLSRAALVEFAAQTAAASAGLERYEQGLPPVAGYLAGVDSFEFRAEAIAGCRLVCCLELRFRIGSVTRATCTVQSEDGTLIAEGDLALATPDSPIDVVEPQS